MLTHLDPPAPAARLWSRRRILLVFLAPLVVLALVFFFYDEGLEPAPDLVPHWTGSGLGSGENGLERLRAAWGPLPEVEHRVLSRWHDTQRQKYIWDDALVDLLNPTRRDLRQDLTDALAAPEWVDELLEARHLREVHPSLPESCYAAMTASAIQKARGGDRSDVISLIRDFRQVATRQFKGGWSLSAHSDATWRTMRAADLTCDLIEEGGWNETELTTLVSIWAADDLDARDLANPLAGHSRFCAAVFRGEAGKEFRFGYWVRHGSIYPSPSGEAEQTWLGLVIQPNATMNAMHRILRSVRDRGLAVTPDRASSLLAALQKEKQPGRDLSLIAHPNAGGILFLDSYVFPAALNVDAGGRLHLFRVRAMRIWLALRHWAIAHDGNLPGTLNELVPGCLREIPADPWDGSALRWDPAGRMIYGVGTDWLADVPVPDADSREWLITQRDGAFEFTSVGFRYDRPPPAKPPVAYPEPRAAPVKKRRL